MTHFSILEWRGKKKQNTGVTGRWYRTRPPGGGARREGEEGRGGGGGRRKGGKRRGHVFVVAYCQSCLLLPRLPLQDENALTNGKSPGSSCGMTIKVVTYKRQKRPHHPSHLSALGPGPCGPP